ncbi:hypothetical protein SISSUDRAFT_1130232 [Sistotremastrum suecicum HHB10207 ss-3]|uniref:Uncharacterized protein n=1 Tax=Sistotremastrum suecicum HHB10207 ss-3 TaxID=1314776 RepID=A0A166BNI1_9AGAM|nr:hypothetical protein SISSUDRAFT_1130232 [Sistotremastrum suecicum HHB10207 ss-3]
MSAISLAKQAFSALNHEKPHVRPLLPSFTKGTYEDQSSITDWIEILTGPNIDDEAYDGIPEILDSINLQPTGFVGPTQAFFRYSEIDGGVDLLKRVER